MKLYFSRRSEFGSNYRWLEFQVIEDGRVTILVMKPALLAGWNLHEVIIQGEEHWLQMSSQAIVAFKREQPHHRLVPATQEEVASIDRMLAQRVAP